ncbi:6-phosphogluconolactonase [Wenzhouxiangella sp. XN24]|uniref:6-phosphogluconolactonase n=1 Tax=Wenzhouxiangella sp. XN24 TaxID=2713569 RepID=UPI0013ED8830|nr:6-phosphogluconolactonase [Wenzhouxiangella sp. XN24]
MSWTESSHADAETLATRVAGQFEALVREALDSSGKAVLALAGGRTPFPIYRCLAEARLDWSRVSLVATDERWVPAGHPARNSREVRNAFGAAAGVHVLELVPAAVGPDADANAEQGETTMGAVSEPFDAVLLGIGADGHFASLFPGAAELAAGLDPASRRSALVVNPVPLPPEAPYPRVSLTLARLMRTKRLFLVATGDAKRAVLDQAQSQRNGPDLPVATLLRRATVPIEIHWSP